jgi:hypothetical protein
MSDKQSTLLFHLYWILSLPFSHCMPQIITNIVELSPSWKAASCASAQELPSILWNPKVHYRVHKSLFWATSIQSIPPHPISLTSILILFTHLCHDLPNGLFPSGFPTKIIYAFLLSPFVLLLILLIIMLCV